MVNRAVNAFSGSSAFRTALRLGAVLGASDDVSEAEGTAIW